MVTSLPGSTFPHCGENFKTSRKISKQACNLMPTKLNAAQDDRRYGEVPEWSNGAVSKTVEPVRVPRVRIPVSPPWGIEIIE